MENTPLIHLIEKYCREAGISPATLGVRAAGNSRLYERLRRRKERDAEVAEKVRRYIAENPPVEAGETTCPNASDAA